MVDKVRPVTKIIDLNSTLLLFTLPILPTSPAVPSPPPPTPVSLDRVIIVTSTGLCSLNVVENLSQCIFNYALVLCSTY